MLNISGLKKKLEGAAKRSACQDIGPWIKFIMNHIYYVASTTPEGDPDVMDRKWRMLALHVPNIHDKCTHRKLEGEARNRVWLIAGNLFSSQIHYGKD